MAGKKQNRDSIRIGDYIISADSLQWILSKERVSRGTKNPKLGGTKGDDILVVLGYYSTLKSLVSAISDDTMRNALGDVDNLRDLVEQSMLKLAENVKKYKSE